MSTAAIGLVNLIIPQSTQPQLQDVTSKVTQCLLQALQTGKFFKQEKQLTQDFSKITPEQLKQVVETFVKDLGHQVHKHNPIKVLSQLAELIPLESLQNAVKIKHHTHKDALQTAKRLLNEAKYHLEKTEKKTSMSLRAALSAIIDTLVNIIESILSAFGVAEFFRPSENFFHADMKFQKIMMLINMFTLVCTLLLPLIGAALGAIIVGGTMLFIATVSLVYPFVQPAPASLPEAKNLSKQAREGQLTCIGGREEAMDDTAKTLISCKKDKRQPLLIGKSGVGKTQTVEALAIAIENGKYPELKGKTVFYINAADLVNSKEMFSGGNRILSKICEAMGRHREDIILVIDEIHMACQKRENNVIADQLKTLIDDKPDNFPYVIGLTTEEDYYADIYKNHEAFARRFKLIPIENTLEEVTLRILSNALLHHSPNAIVERGALKSLLEKTIKEFPDKPQPMKSLSILSQCVERTAKSQKSKKEKDSIEKRNKIESFYSQGAASTNTVELIYDAAQASQIQQLEAELTKLEEELKIEKSQQDQLFQAKDVFAQVRAETFRTVVKVANLETNLAAKDKVQLNKFLLLSHFLEPALFERITKNNLGINTIINDDAIDSVIANEQSNNKKAQAFVNQGQQQLKQRATNK